MSIHEEHTHTKHGVVVRYGTASDESAEYPHALAVGNPDSLHVFIGTPAELRAIGQRILDTVPDSAPFIVTSREGERTWWADNTAHAVEQHHDAFPDDELLDVRQAEPDEPLPPTCDEPGCGATQENPGPSGWDGEHGTCTDHTPGR